MIKTDPKQAAIAVDDNAAVSGSMSQFLFDVSKMTASHATAVAVGYSGSGTLFFQRRPSTIRAEVASLLLAALPDIEAGVGLIPVEEIEAKFGL